MRLLEHAPPGWDDAVPFPTLSVSFAEACRHLGHHPLWADDEDNRALVLLRGLRIPVLGSWTRRAKVYASQTDENFLRQLTEHLQRLGVSIVRLGDQLLGIRPITTAAWPRFQPVIRQVFLHDLRQGEDGLLRGMNGVVRRKIRRSREEGVTVSEVATDRDMRDYCRLANETAQRMGARDVTAAYPDAFFWTVFRRMVPRREAIFLLARAEGRPLAGAMFLVSRDRMTYYHGVSTRDRDLTAKQGPTATFWHAMRLGRERGLVTFDMGAVTPTEDVRHPHHSVYEFKRAWGGTLTPAHSGEVVLAPLKYRFQERVLSPIWHRLHPVYLRAFAPASRSNGDD